MVNVLKFQNTSCLPKILVSFVHSIKEEKQMGVGEHTKNKNSSKKIINSLLINMLMGETANHVNFMQLMLMIF